MLVIVLLLMIFRLHNLTECVFVCIAPVVDQMHLVEKVHCSFSLSFAVTFIWDFYLPLCYALLIFVITVDFQVI